MDQPLEGVEYTHQENTPDFNDLFDAELASQELKVFQVAALFQEAERISRSSLPALAPGDEPFLSA